MRVVYVGHSARWSGGEIALVRLLEQLDGRVERIVVLAEDGPLVAELQRAGAQVQVVPMDARVRTVSRARALRTSAAGVLALARYVLRLRRLLRELRPDLVHTNTLKAALYGGLAGRLAGVPVVWHIRDRIAPDYLAVPLVHMVRFAAHLLPSAVLANSISTRDVLPRLRCPVAVTYDTPSASATPEPAAHDHLSIGMAGRLAPWKGQREFLRAFAAAFPAGETRGVIIGSALFGEDDYAAELHALAADLGLGERVEFRGFRDDMDAEYARLGVLVHYSTVPEPFGQVVVEGMAAGLCVLAAAEGGPLEIVTDGVDGLLVPPRSVVTLATALRRVADDPHLRHSLAGAARHIADRFPPAVCAEPVVRTYEQLTSTRRKPRVFVRNR